MKRLLGKIAAAFLALALATAAATRAQTPTFTVLHSFTNSGGDGATPAGDLIMDATGDLYGSTQFGGASNLGTVFKLDTAGNETVLHSFSGFPSDGAEPGAGLIMDAAGNLFGTTIYGGSFSVGTVFKLDPSGKETVLYSFTYNFTGGADGANPVAPLIMDAAGNLFGTTGRGGGSIGSSNCIDGCGTVLKLDSSGNETVLHSFTGSDGASPMGRLIMDKAGNLYGTTGSTVFKLDPSGNFTVLSMFTGGNGPLMDAAGNLYSTTTGGGAFLWGTVFKLDTSGNKTVLHNFSGLDGAFPFAPVVMDTTGNLYGTTSAGGSTFGQPNGCSFPPGCGSVFKLDPSGNETVLHSFTGADGFIPVAGLTLDAAGNIYGAAASGGIPNNGCAYYRSCGTVFKLAIQVPPTVASISPTSAIAGGPAFGLTVNGTNFVSGSTVKLNGNAAATTFVSATQLTVAVPASDIAAAGVFNVTVTDPGDGTSNAVSFTVVTPQQATQTIIGSVNTLLSQGVINGGQDSSLVGQLQHAINLMNAGKNAGAIGNLDSFITEVNDLLNSGVLTSTQAASLTSTAQSVITAI